MDNSSFSVCCVLLNNKKKRLYKYMHSLIRFEKKWNQLGNQFKFGSSLLVKFDLTLQRTYCMR